VLDFRYHALTLVAVFLALGIGIVLGSSLGDTVVSQANKDIASSLRADLTKARADASDARAQVADRERLIDTLFAQLAGGKLKGKRIAVIGSGDLGQTLQTDVRNAVQKAGGTVTAVFELRTPPELTAIGSAVGGDFANLKPNDKRFRELGRKIGQAATHGGKLAQRLAKKFPNRFSGQAGPVNAVAFYRDPRTNRSSEDQAIEQGLIEGLRAAGDPVVGIEKVETDPSQISFYSNQGLSSVDDVDSAGGRLALVLALAGARGNFGYKNSADSPLPKKQG
jgi:Copper transport outer membrane protein, MctB